MPINFPDSPTTGDIHTIGDKTWTYDGTAWNVVTSSGSDHGNLGGLADDDHTQYLRADGSRSLSGSLLPDTDVTYDLGSSTYRFRDLYLSGNSIDLGGMVISYDGSSVNMVPEGGTSQTFATESYVDTSVSNLVDTAPDTLNTLNELAAALGDDANFATTVTNSLAGKSDTSHTHSYLSTSGGTVSGDITASRYYSTSNGAGTNYRLGDDCWIGDINVANTTRLTGVQNSDRAYLQFGNSGQKLGQAGSGNLTWEGGMVVSGYLQGDAVVGAVRIGANGTDIYGTGGRNYFKDSEKSSGNGLRVGAAWGWYGIYSESGDAVVGATTGIVRFNSNGARVENATIYGAGLDSGGGRLTGNWGGVGAPGVQMRSGNTFNSTWTGSNMALYVDYTHIKNFVIDHPSNPDEQWLIHACSEGPTADVFYRGEAQLSDGIAVIELPEYFEDLAELEGRTVMVTPIANPTGYVANLAAYEVVDGRFVVEQVGGYNVPDQKFWWRVDAVRKNTTFPVQPNKTDVTIGGDGPYRYIQEVG